MTDALIAELAGKIVETLGLEGVDPAGIDPDAPLFGPGGLGLDSIDGLELAALLDKRYGIKFTVMQETREPFASLRNLARFVGERQPRA